MENEKKLEHIKKDAKAKAHKIKDDVTKKASGSTSRTSTFDKLELPLAAKVLAVLCIIQCVISAPVAYTYVIEFIDNIQAGYFSQHSTSTIICYVIFLSCMVITIALMIAIGVYMLLNKRRRAALIANICAIVVLVATISDIMVVGITPVIYILAISIILLVVLKSYLDPSLTRERKAHNIQKKLKDKKDAEQGHLGFSETDKDRPKLNYFNLFWIFFIMSILGYIFEIIWHMTVDNPGVYEERAGLLFGPFSPIYGFGAVIITTILNKFTNKNIIIIFIVSALLGGFFEYFVSLYLEVCFGVRSWDYHHLPFNIDGRTSLRFFVMWGIIGVLWAKIFIKIFVKLINKIPWKLRYSITIITSVFMLVNLIMTFEALDCWYCRTAGNQPQTPIEQFYADNFNDEFMRGRFENMKMNTSTAIRTSES